MKKTLLTLIAASAVILSFVGCKPATKDAIDNDSGSWKGQVASEATGTEKCTVILTNKTGFDVDNSWFVWTDIHGLCIDPQPEPDKTHQGKIIFPFDKDKNFTDEKNYNGDRTTENFVLYIHINGTDPKKGSLTNKDVRGRVCVYKDKKVDIESDKYFEVIEQVGLVSIKNNEPFSKDGTTPGSVFNNGNYRITEIWPLNPQKTENTGLNSQYIVEDTMYFKDLDIPANSASSTTVTFPVKAGKQIIGLYQPDRNKALPGKTISYDGPDADTIRNTEIEIKDYNTNNASGEKQTRANLLNIKTKNSKGEDISDEKIIEEYKQQNDKLIFANMIDVTKHNTLDNSKSNAYDSSSFGEYWFWHKDKKRARTVDGYVDTVELHEGRLEK